MKFCIVDPKEKTVRTEDHPTLDLALGAAGLPFGAVDHGSFRRGLGYVVHEHSFFIPKDEQSYFRIAYQLFGGTTVFYGYDDLGQNIDFDEQLPIHFLTADEVEDHIELGLLRRPRMVIRHPGFEVEDEIVWEWPNQKPPQEILDRRLKAALEAWTSYSGETDVGQRS